MKPLPQWTVVELRAALKKRGQTIGGVKADLIARLSGLIDEENAQKAEAEDAGPQDSPDEMETEQIAKPENENVTNGDGKSDVAAEPAGAEKESDQEQENSAEAEKEDDEAVQAVENAEGSTGAENGNQGEVKETEAGGDDAQEPAETTPEKDAGENQEENGNADLDAMDATKESPGVDGEKAAESVAVEEKKEPAVVPEWQDMDIPVAWLPHPLIKVKSVPADSQVDALKECFEEACQTKVHCVHVEGSEGEGKAMFALIRMPAPDLPWKVAAKETEPAEDKEQEQGDGNDEPMDEGKSTEKEGEQDADGEDKDKETEEKQEETPAEPAKEEQQASSPLEAGGDDVDVKKIGEFYLKKIDGQSVKLGEQVLEFECPTLRTTLFVHNLRDEYGEDEEKFQTECAEHGELLRCFFVRNKEGKSKDYAFVEYCLPSDALRAKEAIDKKSSEALQRFREAKMNAQQSDHGSGQGSILPEKRLRCEWAHHQTVPSIFSKICYISNLPVGFMDRDALRSVFEPYGDIVSCNVRSRAGMGPGCGFVEFANGKDAESAMQALNGTHNPTLGFILVSLVNPAKFPGDTTGGSFQRTGFQKRPRADFVPGRARGFGRGYGMDARGRGMGRGRGRGMRGGQMQPQYGYQGNYPMYGSYPAQQYQQNYYGSGYQYHQQHQAQNTPYKGQYYQQNQQYGQSPYGGQYRGNQQQVGVSSYKQTPSGYGQQGAWNQQQDGSKAQGQGQQSYGGYSGADQSYGQQSYGAQGATYGQTGQQYAQYGATQQQTTGYGTPGYGSQTPAGQTQVQGQTTPYSAASNYPSGYGSTATYSAGYQQTQNYAGQTGYTAPQQGYGNQSSYSVGAYGQTGYGQTGYGQTGYGVQSGDKRTAEYDAGAYAQPGAQDPKRPRY